MRHRTLSTRLELLEQRAGPKRYVVRYELDGVRYEHSPFSSEGRAVEPDEDLGDATLILVRYAEREGRDL
jgi:hypothetical protein